MAKILLVDDDEKNLELLEAILSPLGYDILKADDGVSALSIIKKEKVDLVLLDVMMPEMSGFEVAQRIKADRQIPVILLTSLREKEDILKGLESGADEFLSKPFFKEELLLRIKNTLKLKEYQNTLRERVNRRTAYLKEALKKLTVLTREMAFRLLTAAEYRDIETGKHLIRVGRYSRIICEALGFKKAFLELMENAAPMHDIGKVGIPDNILLKPGKLTPEEFETMKSHTLIGARILEGSEFPLIQMSCAIALTHHEKWDGSGYPYGKKREDIPLSGRIVALTDVFDALSSRRPYRPAFPWDESLNMVKQDTGKSFDPQVVEAFLKSIDSIRAVYDKYGAK